MKKCPYCNTLNPDDAEVCENCGKPLKGQMLALVCPNCGKVNALGSRECSICHTKLSIISQFHAKLHPEKTISGGDIWHYVPSSIQIKQIKILGGLIAELFRGQAVFACVSAFGIKVFNGSFDELFQLCQRLRTRVFVNPDQLEVIPPTLYG